MSQSNNTGTNTVDMNAMLTQSLTQSINAMGNHQYKDGEPDTARLAGIIEMDAAFVKAINTALASFGHLISKKLSPHIYEKVLKGGQSLNTRFANNALSQTALQRTAAGVTLGVNLGIFLGEPASKLYHDMRSQHDARTQFNRQLRMVYSHASDAQGNTVVRAQRRRMSKEASTTNLNTVLTGLGSNLLNLIGEGTNIEALKTGEHRNLIYQRNHQELTDRFRAEIETAQKNSQSRPLSEKAMDIEIRRRIDKEHSNGSLLGFAGGGMLLSQFFQAQATSSQRRLEHHRQPYSAYEMIISLQEQLANNPGNSSRFALPGRRGGELPLDHYVTAIFTQHQKELADFDKDSTEIRDALKEDMQEVGRAIATRIEAGDLDPLMLVRLAGEGEVVKNKGRGLASVDEVNQLIDRFASTKAHGVNADPKEYFHKRAFTLATVKDDLRALKGDERLLFAAAIPDTVLRQAGMNDAEIKKVQQFRASEAYDGMLAALTKGMEAEGKHALQSGGLGNTQIKQLQQAGEAIDRDGVVAIAGIKTSATHAEGIENIVADYVANQIPTNKISLSTLIQAGKQGMQITSEEHTSGSHAQRINTEKQSGYAEDVSTVDDSDFGEEMNHAERVRASRGGHHSRGYEG